MSKALPAARCPSCAGRLSPSCRTKVRGVFWCRACARGLQSSIHGHCTATIARVDALNRGKAAGRTPERVGIRIETDEDTAERDAMVAFLVRLAREAGEQRWSWRGAMRRLELVAEGIARDRLAPADAVARLEAMRAAGDELLDERIRFALKGMRLGKHRAKTHPRAGRFAPPSHVRIAAGAELVHVHEHEQLDLVESLEEVDAVQQAAPEVRRVRR